MKFIDQKYLHIEGSQKGDCWRACIASILECDIEVLPDPNKIDDWATYFTDTVETVRELGFDLCLYNTTASPHYLNSPDTDNIIMAIGKSPRSTGEKRINHCVVWKNGIIHDPHPDKTGILDIIEFDVLKKIIA